jgi:prepilin-type N-terminal cleavage/methylation domain-containing protein
MTCAVASVAHKEVFGKPSRWDMTGQRKGFTLMEIITVCVIMGVVMMMALPKYGNMNDRNQMRSAKDGLAARISAARAAAVASGKPSMFSIIGDTMRVTLISNGATFLKGADVNLYRQFGVSMTSGNTTVRFDGRGMSNQVALKLKFSRGSLNDSLCVSKLGLINRHGCAQ